MNIQGWFPLRLTGLISLLSKGLSRVFSSTTVGKRQFFRAQPSLWSNSHLYLTTGKTKALTVRPVRYTAVTCSAIHHLASRWRCLPGAPGPIQPLQPLRPTNALWALPRPWSWALVLEQTPGLGFGEALSLIWLSTGLVIIMWSLIGLGDLEIQRKPFLHNKASGCL